MERNGYAKPVLVSTGWLAENLCEEGLVLVEVDEHRGLYDEGHIAGAVELDWKEDLQDPCARDLVGAGPSSGSWARRGSATTRR